MKIAYLISAFKDPQHLKNLVKALDSEGCMFFIHVDRKMDIRHFKNRFRQDNVVFIKDRVFVYWATYSQVVFQMKLIKAALDYGIAFDKLFMLSGQDYPLWSNDRIHQWVEQTKGKDMISGICIDSDEVAEKNKQIYRLCRPQTDIRWIGAQFNSLVSKTIRKTLKTIGIRKELSLNVNGKIWHLYKGSDYFAITLDTARFVFDTLNANKEIQEYFESSFAPSETCIHTILFNNPEYAAKANLHKGPYKSLAALTPLHHIVYDPIIKVWTNDDYDELISSDKMFARKFETGISDSLIEHLNHSFQR